MRSNCIRFTLPGSEFGEHGPVGVAGSSPAVVAAEGSCGRSPCSCTGGTEYYELAEGDIVTGDCVGPTEA